MYAKSYEHACQLLQQFYFVYALGERLLQITARRNTQTRIINTLISCQSTVRHLHVVARVDIF